MEIFDPGISSFSLLRAWISICRECGCSEEQISEMGQIPEKQVKPSTFFQEFTPSQELELEDVAMWLGEGPPRPLN
jgi:hypothetical protein